MKKIIYCLLLAILVNSYSYSQERDYLIQLYSGIGDTLDYIDKEIFDLYPDIEGFKYAQLFNRDDEFLVSKITCLKNGIFRDTLLINDLHQLYLLRQTLSRFISENDKKLGSPLDATLFTKSGNSYEGKLQLFSKKYLYLNSDFNNLTGNSSGFGYKTPFSIVDSVQISIKANVGPYIGYGALGGATLGAAVGLYWINTENFWKGYGIYIVGITTLTGVGIGVLLGWLIGETMPPDFVNIRFNTPYDVTKLKDYSAYYFQYNKAIEDKYVELD